MPSSCASRGATGADRLAIAADAAAALGGALFGGAELVAGPNDTLDIAGAFTAIVAPLLAVRSIVAVFRAGGKWLAFASLLAAASFRVFVAAAIASCPPGCFD
jgi:hypothetical protein